MSEKTIIEINGIKLEVDLRNAKRIDEFKVGDNVKLLLKEYGDSYKSFPAVIVGFDQFEKLPTIIICYCDISYSKAEIKFVYLNSGSKDIEICHMGDHEKLLDKQKATDYLDSEISKKEAELMEMKRRRIYFLDHYNKHFEA